MMCQSALWPKTGSKTMRLCRRWLSPAASLACFVHPGITDILTGIKRNQWESSQGCLSISTLPLPSPSSLQIPLPPSLFRSIVPILQTVSSFSDSPSSPLSGSSPSKWSQAYSCCEEQGGGEISEQLLLQHHSVVCLLCQGRGGRMQGNLQVC